MGMTMDSYAFFTALAGESSSSGLIHEVQHTIESYSLTAFILHDPNKSRSLNRHLTESFEMLDHSTGRNLLFVSLVNRPGAREREFWMSGRIYNPRITGSNTPMRITANAFATALGISEESLPCIVVCNDPRDKTVEWFKTDAASINNQLNQLGMLASHGSRLPFKAEQRISLDPLHSCGSLKLSESPALIISNLLSLILAGQGRREGRRLADKVVNSLNQELSRLKAQLDQNPNDPEAAEALSKFCLKSGNFMALLNQPGRRSHPPGHFMTESPQDYGDVEDRTSDILFQALRPRRSEPGRRKPGELRSPVSRIEDTTPTPAEEQNLKTLRISQDLLEPESISMLYTARTLIDAFSNPTLDIDMQHIDATPILIMIANFFENEINYSVVQWMRQRLGIEMPEYYYRHRSGKAALIEISADFRIDLNELRDGKLLLPSMGNARHAFKHLTELHPDPLQGEIGPQRFIAEWDSIRRERNTAAHPGIVHPEQVNVIVGPLHRLNRGGAFHSMYELKNRLRK